MNHLRFLLAVLITVLLIVVPVILCVVFWKSFIKDPYLYNPTVFTVSFYIFGSITMLVISYIVFKATVQRISAIVREIEEESNTMYQDK